MKKHKEEFVEETEEQKQARWEKQKKAARGLAKSCGIDLKKLERERHESQQARPPCPSKPMSIELVMPSNHLILCRPPLLLPSIFPSIRVFSNDLPLHIRWPKYWSFSFSNSPTNEYSGLVSFRIDWFDLPAVQGRSNQSILKKIASE